MSHGHVVPRPDGAKARCGGPGICVACTMEELRQRINAERAEFVLPSDDQARHEIATERAMVATLRAMASAIRERGPLSPEAAAKAMTDAADMIKRMASRLNGE